MTSLLRGALRRTSSGWGLVTFPAAAVVMAYLVSCAPVFFSASHLERVSTARILDLRFGFGESDGTAALAKVDEAGARPLYLCYLAADLLFLVLYAIALASLLYALFGKKTIGFSVVPLIAAAFDAVEDLGSFIALVAFPGRVPFILTIAGAAGVFKFLFFFAAFLLLLPGGFAGLNRYLKRRGRR